MNVYDLFGEDASGVVANRRQARDPRYSMSLSPDVGPGEIDKQLKKYRLAEDEADTARLDAILVDLCAGIIRHKKQDSERYGLVAAAVVDPDNNVVYGINNLQSTGKRVHAERAALENYKNKHGAVPEGSIIVTTLSPCTEPMADREGISCTELIDSTPVRRVYAGYRDPSQDHLAHDDFDVVVTNNSKLEQLCRGFADCFLKDTVTEIEAIPGWQYSGGKEILGDYNNINPSQLKPLPGGSGLVYAIESESYLTRVFIVDPQQDSADAIAVLELAKDELPIKGKPLAVETITVDEDYRGRGLAKALYGIVLTVMKRTLVAGHAQTPGGRRNWLSLASIPGVEVKGVVQIEHRQLQLHGNNTGQQIDKTIDQIMQLGGQFIGKDKYSSYWAFDVVAGKGQLQPAVKNTLSRLYGYDATTTLIATWTGRAESINEDQDVDSIAQEFVEFVNRKLKFDQQPNINFVEHVTGTEHPTFGSFDSNTNVINIGVSERHVMDIMRTLAHELVHHKQRETKPQSQLDGGTASRDENQANSVAGTLMREFADQHPEYFGTIEENFADGRNPQDKGDSKRYHVPTKASVSTLRKVAKQGGRKGQLAHWMANMKAGRARARKK